MTFWDRTKAKKADFKAGHERSSKEDKRWESVLFDERLQDDFTNRVMIELEGMEIEPIDGINASEHDVLGYLEGGQTIGNAVNDTSIAAQVKHQRITMSSSSRKAWGIAAAAIILSGSMLLYAQPTLAEMVRSLFAQNSYVDNGMKHAQEAGMVQISGASAVDQGYTLKVNEVIADSTRLIIGIDIFDAKGNAVVGEIQSTDADFTIMDIQGAHFGDVSHAVNTGGNQTTSRIQFTFNRPVLTDKLQLNAHISQLIFQTGEPGGDFSVKRIKGDWTLRFQADLTKAKAQTLLTPIDITYETQGGIRIHMLGATRTPSGGSLEFTTALTKEAGERAINGQSGFHIIKYHLEDAQGKILDESPELTEMEFSSRKSVLDRWSGLTNWFNPFDNFPYDKQQIRFVLDSYVIREKSEAEIMLDPSKLSAENPVKLEESGDIYLIKGMTVDRGFGWISLGDVHNESTAGESWVAMDEKGKEYYMYLAQKSSNDNTNQEDARNDQFIIEGMKEMPKQLTIKRNAVNRVYKDVDWSFVIPQTGTIGVVPQ